ncbi:DNA binding protein [Scheffersomyces spartinae]|uniref:DNA binding protein n=1 Tax=Scheffersomyces spartinae TaxID=45513 RepID=A0A9P7VCZ6_9ASCO|nr:DNA binding protein [Scheffersomyces spartinae]KAG7195579.1 DNA binding protein [Scheffersomyces spartinae]
MAHSNSSNSDLLIEELLRIALYSITYLRCIFDENSYKWAKYRFPNELLNNNDTSSHSIRYKQLIKGSNQNVDRFLSWIDSGVSDAIMRRALKGLQLTIASDSDHPDEPRECYLFMISYNHKSISVSSQNSICTIDSAHSMTTSTRDKLRTLLKNLIDITEDLNTLPSLKRISINLLINETSPKYYQPSGFRSTGSSQFPLLGNVGEEGVIKLDSVNTGYHTFGVAVYTTEVKSDNVLPYLASLSGSVVKNTFDEAQLFTKNRQTLVASRPDTVKLCECKFLLGSKYPQKSFDCIGCKRHCHLKCYGYTDTDLSFRKKCFTCILGKEKVDFDILILMRSRIYFGFLKCFPFPKRLLQIGVEIFDLSKENLVLIINKMLKLFLMNGVIVFVERTEVTEVGCGSVIVDIQTSSEVLQLTNHYLKWNSMCNLAFYPITRRYTHKKRKNPLFVQSKVVTTFCRKWNTGKIDHASQILQIVRKVLQCGGYFNLASQVGTATMNYLFPSYKPSILNNKVRRCSLEADAHGISATSSLLQQREKTSFLHIPLEDRLTGNGFERSSSFKKGKSYSHGSEVTDSSIRSPTFSELGFFQTKIHVGRPTIISDELNDISFEDSFAMLSQTQK